jgi:hypothetical protein
MSATVLKQVAHKLVTQASNDTIYETGLLDPISKKCMNIPFNSSWIEQLQVTHGLSVRRSTGKGILSPEMTKEMHRAVARHLGELKRQLDSRLLDKAAIENGDETHVMVNMDSSRSLAAIGDADVKYADVVSGGVGMTLSSDYPVELPPSSCPASLSSSPPVLILSKESRIPCLSSRIELAQKDGWIAR